MMKKIKTKYFEINEDGINIKCKLYFNEGTSVEDVVICCHGFAGSKENNGGAKLSESLISTKENMAVLSFDWPCHGKDVRQKLSLVDCNNYLAKVIEYTKRNFQTENIYSFATSFGGYLTLKYIYEHGNPFKKVFLRCPAVNMRNVLTDVILTPEQNEMLERGKDVVAGFEKKVRISKKFMDELAVSDITKFDYTSVADDIMIAHGSEDEVVSFDVSRQFANQNNIGFIDIEGANHTYKDPAKLHEVIAYANEFIYEDSLNNSIGL